MDIMVIRRILTLVLFLFMLVALKSCSQNKIGSPAKILILGNSITEHGSAPNIGWYGDWGMAASSREKDFVHVLMDMLQTHYSDIEWDFRYKNIAGWEANFEYDFSSDELIHYQPDILIIRLGENVKDNYAQASDYEGSLEKLINTFKSPNSHVVITDNFWPSVYRDSIQERVALKNNYTFVDLTSLSQDSRNQAVGLFDNGGVAAHPSDFGMRNIASRIFIRMRETKLVP